MSKPTHSYDFIPADTLFCRDQRPLQAGSSFGHGANWPLPTVLHSAIRTALLAANGGLPQKNSLQGHERRGVKRGKIASDKFSWLNLHGPFPVDENGTTYFPIPRDLVPDGDETKAALLRIIPNPTDTNNLPRPLTHLAASFSRPSKNELPGWVSIDFYNRYLAAHTDKLDAPAKAELWESEHRVGVAIDPNTHTAKEGQLYAAEHLRVRDGVRLRFAISEDPHAKETADLTGFTLQLGGEQRFGYVKKAPHLTLPATDLTGTRVKWILLTPAIFACGWRPGWVADDGSVRLRIVNGNRAKRRHERDHNANWNYDPARYGDQAIRARLVAAVVGKPQVVGGWDDAPKPTYLAVPSGSVYYFEAHSEEDAQRLVQSLQHRCKSDFFGEKGLGLGVCGTWQEATA